MSYGKRVSKSPNRSTSIHVSTNSTSSELMSQEFIRRTKSLGRSSNFPLLHAPSSSSLSPHSVNKRGSNSDETKIVVLGAPSVGKSALVVRLLTGRFIWEYDPTLEASYRHSTVVDEELAVMEILDTAGINGGLNDGNIKWGDGFLLVYSLSDRHSFSLIPSIHASIADEKQTYTFPCAIVANKMDLTHSAEILEEEAEAQAASLGVALFLTSACIGGPEIHSAFSEVHRDITRRRFTRRRKSSAKNVIEGLCKMFAR